MSATFRYRSFVRIGELAPGECTIHHAERDGRTYWLLWLCLGLPSPDDHAGIAVNPNGDYAEDGAGGKTWGLRQVADGAWFVAPSVNVLGMGEVHPGEHASEKSIWHENVVIDGVALGEVWSL
jgi:hypothetical protein